MQKLSETVKIIHQKNSTINELGTYLVIAISFLLLGFIVEKIRRIIMNPFIEQALLIKDELINYRRIIHENPEVGAVLPKTKAFVMDKLKEFEYEQTESCVSGIVATISGEKPGKTFLLRADMDALPMKEETSCDFKSTNGCMHSCGHDMHTAMLLGAAKLLKQNQSQIEGTIKLVFQPDEEGFTGAKKMIAAGERVRRNTGAGRISGKLFLRDRRESVGGNR